MISIREHPCCMRHESSSPAGICDTTVAQASLLANAIAQASLLALRPKASKNRRQCHYGAITSWKLVLHCYKPEACDTAVAQASLLALRPKASKIPGYVAMTAKVSVVHPHEIGANFQIGPPLLKSQAGSLCYTVTNRKLVLHPHSSVADKTSSHRRFGNGGDPGEPQSKSTKTLCVRCASARE